MWQNTTLGDCSFTKEVAQFFIIFDSEADESGSDSSSLVIFGGISSKFKNFSAYIFHYGGNIDGGTCSSSGGVSTISHVSGNSTDWESDSGSGGSAG